jgi:hypothetical protein
MEPISEKRDTELRSNDSAQPDGAQAHGKNPRRVEAGRRNRLKRRPLSEEARARLRAAICRRQPWKKSTGPRTAQGKQQSARNGKSRQLGPMSVREMRAELADVPTMIDSMRAVRREATRSLKANDK